MSQSHSHTHGHSHGHSHGHHDLNGKNLLFATVLNLLITVAEFIGGIVSGSLALLSDAVHNLGDTIAILMALVADKVGKRSANEKKTFGYKRIEIITALFNAVTLIVISIFLFKEAYERFLNPQPIKGLIMFVVATIGLLANLFSVLLLHKQSSHNLNVKAAYLHLLGDTISSVAVIIGSVLIYFFKVYWVDPLITIIIGAYIIKEAFSITRESLNVLMMSTPDGVELNAVKLRLEQIHGIANIHHVHVWQLSDHRNHFECHADLEKDIPVSESNSILRDIEAILKSEFGISHVTIQVEYNCCNDKKMIKHD